MAAASMAALGVAAGSVAPARRSSACALSSSASFGSPLVSAVAPIRPAAAAQPSVMVSRAALSEEQSGKTARREMLASLTAAAAAIASAGSGFAASGPGTNGPQRTSEKASDLLKAADDFTTKDSPPRFGPGRVGEGDQTSTLAQKSGAGAIESLQGPGGASIEGAKQAVAKAKTRIDGIFGKKTGDISDASSVLDGSAGKVSSDLNNAQSKVKSGVSTAKGKTDSLVADAKSKADSATKDSKGIVGDIVEKIQEVIPGQ